MNVIKRDGSKQPVAFDKITERLRLISEDLDVSPTELARTTIAAMHDGISTTELDNISASSAYEMSINGNTDYATLATRILASNMIKNAPKKFSDHIAEMAKLMPKRMNKIYCDWIMENAAELDKMIIDDRDYNFRYPGLKLLERLYLISKPNGAVYDRPQYMYMRVAVAVFSQAEGKFPATDKRYILNNIYRMYNALSNQLFTMATPTMLNACMSMQLNSCFLLGTGDSIEEIQDTKRDAAIISKSAGGLGIHMSNIRPAGELIESSGGKSSGLIPQLKIYNEEACTWNQGGKRLGAYAIFIEMWHGDILRFLRLKQPDGPHKERAEDLFYGLWVCDLFLKRCLANNGKGSSWSLFSEKTAPHLSDTYDGMPICVKCGHSINPYYNMHSSEISGVTLGTPCESHQYQPQDIFTQLYERYEREGRAVKVIHTSDITYEMTKTQSEAGVPYVCHKDHVNRQTNQQNIGTIKSSNLCTEIMEYSSGDSYACCTLASVNLAAFVRDMVFDYDLLDKTVKLITEALDRVISINKYPVPKCIHNAENYRPIGIGVQGLANVFIKMGMPYLSDAAERTDMKIFKTIYKAALTQSVESAIQFGPYTNWNTSPLGTGKFRWELWDDNPRTISYTECASEWDELREKIKCHGIRHSLHIALMPTASTSIILGNPESTEPWHAMAYVSTTVAGKFTIIQPELARELKKAGLWTDSIRREIINTGKISHINGIPQNIKEIFKTVWEMQQKEIMRRAALRSRYIDQSQSLNMHIEHITEGKLLSIFAEGWRLGLMTGSYYIRSLTVAQARKTEVNKKPIDGDKKITMEADACPIGCDSCSS